MTADAAPQASSRDYLTHPSVAAYFAAREHETYYRSLKSADERRAFHDQLKTVLLDFVGKCDESTLTVLDEIIGRAARAANLASAGAISPVATARALEPRGVELLQLGSSIDFDELRGAYRQAALSHHPDRGGATADMAAINAAYELLHAAIANHTGDEEEGLGEYWVGARTGRDYVYIATRLLFDVALDDWALDEASALLDTAVGALLTTTTFDQGNELIAVIPPASKLAERLVAAGMMEEARRALAIAEEGLGFAKKRGLLYDGMVSQAREVLSGARKPRFVLNHVRQIDNAHRLGAIDDKRYGANLSRVQGKNAQAEEDRSVSRELLAGIRFTEHLSADAHVKLASRLSAGLVPQPGYFEVRIEELTSDQQVEYANAFTPPYELELIEKYAFVRLSSLVRSAIFADIDDPERLAAEAQHVGDLQPKADWCAERVARVLGYFSKLPTSERRAYAEELAKLLEPPSTTVGFFTITVPHPARELSGQFLDAAVAVGRRRTNR